MPHAAAIIIAVVAAVIGIPLAVRAFMGSLDGRQRLGFDHITIEHTLGELNRQSRTPRE